MTTREKLVAPVTSVLPASLSVSREHAHHQTGPQS
jgi:hypothetical protein